VITGITDLHITTRSKEEFPLRDTSPILDNDDLSTFSSPLHSSPGGQ